jgi:hypothetical protein
VSSPTYKICPLVYIKFYDHVSGSADNIKPIVCEMFGILRSEDALCYTVCAWICEFNLSDPNTDAYCILKSTVLEFEYLIGGPDGVDKTNTKRLRSGKIE